MRDIPQQIDVIGVPDFVKSWSAVSIPNFVYTVLDRWDREFGALPDSFYIVMCPQVEINARGGLPEGVHEYIDPRLRCRQFTGCHKPYFFAIFKGKDAHSRCLEVLQLLAWSEAYQVKLENERMVLIYQGSTEEPDDDGDREDEHTRFKNLISTGQLIQILE